MDNNVLLMLPAKARQVIYITYGLLALGASGTQVGYAALSIENPAWLTVALAVTTFLAVPVGALAASNVVDPEPRRAKWDEPDVG